ncbi:MAG: hypothetical protein E6Q53_01465 [Candidatus Moraniibacteriota bacterium]|nr:MAG: hypothetical protein E6Q53_01465 [Candidatus Moranbacteria bacterium]
MAVCPRCEGNKVVIFRASFSREGTRMCQKCEGTGVVPDTAPPKDAQARPPIDWQEASRAGFNGA